MSQIHIKEKLSEIERIIPQDRAVFVIIDNNLKHLYSYFSKYEVIWVDAGEEKKNMETILYLQEELLMRNADRSAFIVGVGGGIVTDMAGFAASIYKRGVSFAFVPTTLLAQVDASIGGKNGVNLHAYKNIIGTITQPEWVYICGDVLETLHPREFRAGIAEVLKTFILFDKEYYGKAVEHFSSLNISGYSSVKSSARLTEIVGKCAGYKSQVVARDELEKGERRYLNLGHTFAHAIEKVCGDNPHEYAPVMHGEAVAIGILLAARIAEIIYGRNNTFSEKLKEDFLRVGLPVSLPVSLKDGKVIPMEYLVSALKKDKKIAGDSIHFILPKGLGDVEDKLLTLKELEAISLDLR